ncbi:MAG TPA: PhoD-like phosphatase N-terminal domain-containing protein [Thermoanaerobaculia bacterium]
MRFDHGVASGDPLADAVILWTRVTPVDAGDPRPVPWSGRSPRTTPSPPSCARARPSPTAPPTTP